MQYFLIFWILLFVHFLYDFEIQSEFVGVLKSKNNFLLAIHSFLWSNFLILTMVVLKYTLNYRINLHVMPIAFIFLFITHYHIDGWKAHLTWRDDKFDLPEYWNALYIDQIYHLITIIMFIAMCMKG